MDAICQAIHNSAQTLKSHPSFVRWLSQTGAESGDVIVINNSFVYRHLATRKSDRYLAFRMEEHAGVAELKPWIAQDFRMNSDLKRLGGESRNLPPLGSLLESVQQEMPAPDSLVFALIAYVDDSVVLEEPLQGSEYSRIVCDPSASPPIRLHGDTITVCDTLDEDAIWDEIVTHYTDTGEEVPDGLRDSVGECLGRLQGRAIANLRFPSDTQGNTPGIADAIVDVLREQRARYAEALQQCGMGGDESSHYYNEVLRIAYNFASDATMFLRLVVSVCDLRPIVLWGTIGEHYALSEAFKALPLGRGQRKFSLKSYASTVGDARNSAFHNLFPFRKTLRLALPASALHNASVRIFVEHGKKREDRLTYQEKELVDVLLQFTRARYRRAPSRYWQKNLDVMDAAIALFSRTSEYLKTLHAQALSVGQSSSASK